MGSLLIDLAVNNCMGARTDCGIVRRSFRRQEGAEVEVGRPIGSRQIELLQDLLAHIAAVADRLQCPVHGQLAMRLRGHIRLHPREEEGLIGFRV